LTVETWNNFYAVDFIIIYQVKIKSVFDIFDFNGFIPYNYIIPIGTVLNKNNLIL